MENVSTVQPQRRKVVGRNVSVVKSIALSLNDKGISPNRISIASIGFAVLGAAGILLLGSGAEGWLLWLTVALTGILLRCLCNLWDGMVAIEGGKSTQDGAFFNEVPDRISDAILLIAAGLAWQMNAEGGFLGVSVALLAVSVAYIRAVGGQLCGKEDFSGPMAKPIRMGVLAFSLVAFPIFGSVSLLIGLLIIGLGSLLTIALRSRTILNTLRK